MEGDRPHQVESGACIATEEDDGCRRHLRERDQATVGVLQKGRGERR